MKSVQAGAPGKVIIFGEHAVVYGRPAIAVPVSRLQAQAMIQAGEQATGFRVIAPDLDREYLLSEAADGDPLAATIRNTLDYLGHSAPDGVALRVSSTIPLGRGLGSGAAISTAIVRALGQWFEQPLPPAVVSKLVYEIEKIYHGTPSGIDNTVVAFEQPVYFVRGQPPQKMRVDRPFHLIVGDTGLTSPTHKVVGQVRRHWHADPEQYEGYFDEIGIIVEQARAAIEQGVTTLPMLGKLMNENQEVLESLGVSSPELGRLITAARNAGALGAKLSGAGRGGNMIALIPANPDIIGAVSRAITEAGATGLIITEVS